MTVRDVRFMAGLMALAAFTNFFAWVVNGGWWSCFLTIMTYIGMWGYIIIVLQNRRHWDKPLPKPGGFTQAQIDEYIQDRYRRLARMVNEMDARTGELRASMNPF